MRYYLIAGEASGDLHGANLMRGILEADPFAQFRFWGGDKMAAAGGAQNLARHYKTTSFMGFVEVLRNAGTILAQLNECKTDVAAYAPDVLILIDYPGFNFRMAKFARLAGIRTFYYISPKVWAWKESRIKLIRRYVDRLFIIFPFEIDYFLKRGIDAIYEGNPIMDVVSAELEKLPTRDAFFAEQRLDSRPVVALLAGSRRAEIHHNLPFMADLAERFPSHQFVVAGVPWLDRSVYERALAQNQNPQNPVKYVCDRTYPLLAYADAAVVTSGTATLETALVGTPELVCFRGNPVTIAIAQALVRSVRYISLVNLILGREAVRELIQREMTIQNAENELNKILTGGTGRKKMLSDFAELQRLVGDAGASDRFGARMVSILKTEIESQRKDRP